MKKIILVVIITGLLASCEATTYQNIDSSKSNNGTLPPVTGVKVTYTANIKSIIDTKCIGCHNPDGMASFRDFTNYSNVKEAIDLIIDRTNRPQGASGMMPRNGIRLSKETLSLIDSWKADGLLEK